MTKPLKELSKQVYEAMADKRKIDTESRISNQGRERIPLHIGYVLENIYSQIYWEHEERDERVIKICDEWFELGLHKPIPHDPTEEWRNVLELLVSLIEGWKK